MSDIDYPPSRTWRLGEALATADERLDEDEDGNSDISQSNRDGLAWAVEQWSDDAEITLEAFTTTTRDRAVDTANRATVGGLGASALRTWLVAASIKQAPWLDGSEDLVECKQTTGNLPPGLVDWLDAQLEDLNDLGN